jgi:hypothetical protein
VREPNALHHHEKRDPHSGMHEIVQVIIAIKIIHVVAVVVSPIFRPRVEKDEGVAAVNKALLASGDPHRADGEGVASTKLLSKPVVGDVRALASGPLVSLATFRCGPHLIPRALIFASLLLPVFFRRFGLILARGVGLIAAGLGSSLRPSLRLPGFSLPRLLLPWRSVFVLSWFLSVYQRGTRDQEAENDKIQTAASSHKHLQELCY